MKIKHATANPTYLTVSKVLLPRRRNWYDLPSAYSSTHLKDSHLEGHYGEPVVPRKALSAMPSCVLEV